jgi:aspartyl-tRNA(Asn)/glutamyl-tRNA(Gln) amidotransferase subunit B
MEEGSLRVDANVSLRPTGTDELGTKVEVKNMNSLRSLGRAIESEIERQGELLDSGERVPQETRHWDEADGRTHGMRSKEEANDYRYFPEPDLVPIAPDGAQLARAADSVPELPGARRERLVEAWGIADADAVVLVDVEGLAAYAEVEVAALTDGTPREVVNWATGAVLAFLNETGVRVGDLALEPGGLAELVGLVARGTISRNQAQDVLGEALRTGSRPSAIVAERGMEQVSDEGALAEVVDRILSEHPDDVDAYRTGDDKVRKKKRGYLMGEAMKALQGQGNPQVLNQLLDERLER